MKRIVIVAIAGLAFTMGPAVAGDKDDQATIRQALAKVIPEDPDTVQKTPVNGLYEVSYGTQLFYVSADGRFLLQGDLVDLKSRTNLTEGRRSTARLSALEKAEASMIVYKPKGQTKHTVSVFTDIDCPYCRKLHDGMKEMNDLGIEVRYLAYPRAGAGSASWKKAASVWCAKDRNKAMDTAKGMGDVEPATCDDPVAAHMALGQALGVSGTPALVLEDGRMVPGYMPPERLLQVLEGKI
ncbi:MAG: DsbC family protein [Gammaproteobacteria bacterium]|nr:DsbC family protein [Gammaproteobacteria bacterium]